MEEERVISQGSSKTTLPAEEPAVAAAAAAAAPPVPPLGLGAGDAFDEPARSDNSAILGLPASTYGSVLGDDDEDGEAYDDMSDDDSSSDSDSDGEFDEEHGNRVKFWDGDAAGSEADLVVGPVTFLGRPMTRFASFQGVAGFMRLSTEAAAAPGGGEDRRDEGGVIVVHYRLTRFSRPHQRSSSGGRRLGVDLHVRDFGTSLHHVRYRVPFPVAAAAADPASSLRLVGAALAADVYPYRHYVQLQAVWSSLVAALPVRVPAMATRVVVTVDVGLLPRSEDRTTPERMERVRDALAVLARENDVHGASPPMAACGLEQHLPAPVPVSSVCRDDESGGGHRPAKRMKRFAVVAGEVCAICHETLEHGLAAWPRCSHVFHGKCLEQLLVTVQHRCPMCRSTLSIKGSMFD